MSQSVWLTHPDHPRPPFARKCFGRIAEIRASLNDDGRADARRWRAEVSNGHVVSDLLVIEFSSEEKAEGVREILLAMKATPETI
jgi:hypothetical protein